MEKITTRKRILDVVTAWENQYCNSTILTDDKKMILDNLRKLDLGKATKKQVDDIIGNSSWTDLRCNECNKYVGTAIQLGEEPDYESRTADICIPCLKKALTLK